MHRRFSFYRQFPTRFKLPFQTSFLHRLITLGLASTVMIGLCAMPFQASAQPAGNPDSGPSILNPSHTANLEYRYPINFVDPPASAETTKTATNGEPQLVIYTPAFGSTTGTNNATLELVVDNGVITQVRDTDNTPIPANGFVISGHGSAANWLSRFGQTGAAAALESAPGQIQISPGQASQLMIRMTPQVFHNQVQEAMDRAQSRPAVNGPRYQQILQEAKSCQAQLLSDTNPIPTPEMINLSHHCVDLANVAFYNTIASKPGEFRGAWLRPSSTDPESVRKVIASLKQNHINQIFLETYYQGKTSYPSAVMAEYGLQQHPQFQGGDPVKVWVAEAHQAGIKINLWAQIFFAGNKNENVEQYGPILTRYPQWRNIQRMNLNASGPMPSQIEPGHFFVDPANPEVRAYLDKLLLEMVNTYDIDGLNLDYIRYPASAPANRGNYLETTWGYTPAAREQFRAIIEQERQAAQKVANETSASDRISLEEDEKVQAVALPMVDSVPEKSALETPIPEKAIPEKKETKSEKNVQISHAGKPSTLKKPAPLPSADPVDLTPNNPLWPRWVTWRKAQVTSFVKDISEKAHAIKPNLLVSAVVFPSLNPIYAQKLQDYPRWAEEGYIQALTPIGFSTVPSSLEDQATKLRAQIHDKVPVYAGIFGMYNRNQPVELVRQIDAAHQAGLPGVVLFDWSRLTPEYNTALQEGPFRE